MILYLFGRLPIISFKEKHKLSLVFFVEKTFNVLGGKKYFDRGVPLYFEIELIMNFIPNESPGKMGFIGIKQ